MSVLFSTWTVLVCAVFLGVVAWALSSKRTPEFDEAARIPLEDDVTDAKGDVNHG